MNRLEITANDIIIFLEYHNRPGFFGRYNEIKGTDFPIYKMNLDELQLWGLIEDFFSTFSIDNSSFRHDSPLVISGIKMSFTKNIKVHLFGCQPSQRLLNVNFLLIAARCGIWSEKFVNMQGHLDVTL